MRLINELVRTILKLLINIDIETAALDLLSDSKEQDILNALVDLIENGNINEAENRLFDMISTDNQESLKTALLFYYYLNEKDDDFLKEHDFSREEIQSGLTGIISKFGLDGMVEAFLS